MIWLRRETLNALNDRHRQDWPTAGGVRDEAVLTGIIDAAQERGSVDIWLGAAIYGHGIATRKPFNGGNKHVAFGAVAVFLDLNGYELAASSLDLIGLFNDVEGGDVAEAELAAWLEGHTTRTQP